MFEKQNTKQKFFNLAKEAHGNNPNKKEDFLKFY
jgi:hypothetical protein